MLLYRLVALRSPCTEPSYPHKNPKTPQFFHLYTLLQSDIFLFLSNIGFCVWTRHMSASDKAVNLNAIMQKKHPQLKTLVFLWPLWVFIFLPSNISWVITIKQIFHNAPCWDAAVKDHLLEMLSFCELVSQKSLILNFGNLCVAEIVF